MTQILKLYYANTDFLIYSKKDGDTILQFKNGKRDASKIKRALNLCSMSIKEKHLNYYLLEVANG